jgi:hypothetical protein
VLLLQAVIEYVPQCGIEDFVWRAENKSTVRQEELTLH